jgi:hypothetical protein
MVAGLYIVMTGLYIVTRARIVTMMAVSARCVVIPMTVITVNSVTIVMMTTVKAERIAHIMTRIMMAVIMACADRYAF